MNETERLEKYQKAEKLLEEGLGLIRQRREDLEKRISPASSEPLAKAKPAVGVDDRAGATALIKNIHAGGGFNIYDQQLRSLPPDKQDESEVLKQVKQAHQTKRLTKEELLG
jgi:hypothetical protein